MITQLRIRFWLESMLAALAYGLGIVTLFWRDWIETVFGVDPDNHSGAIEWLIVLGLFVVAAVSSLAAGVHWRRTRRMVAASLGQSPTM